MFRAAKRLVAKARGRIAPIDLAAREEHARKLAAVCASLATGLEVYAKHARDDDAKKLAAECRVAVEEALRVAQASRPAVRTCDRLRWEWLLATSLFADEVKRLMAEAAEHAEKSGVHLAPGIAWSVEAGAWSLVPHV